jgi:hypothetical protein
MTNWHVIILIRYKRTISLVFRHFGLIMRSLTEDIIHVVYYEVWCVLLFQLDTWPGESCPVFPYMYCTFVDGDHWHWINDADLEQCPVRLQSLIIVHCNMIQIFLFYQLYWVHLIKVEFTIKKKLHRLLQGRRTTQRHS